MAINIPEAQTAPQGPENPSDTQEVSKSVTVPEAPVKAVSDPLEIMRAELAQEYAGKFARAELRVQAAQAGVTIPDALSDALDTSKLLDADGQPNTDLIASIVDAIPKEPMYAQNIGLGRQGGPIDIQPRFNINPNRY
ncbi:hypothetical protein [Streptomyces sp. HUAS TT7]|uniref:hypothetical protein n=1 Tax=Streptomyces sp. HUAS TT7 TaxID=3447507 RepID=UPI003F659DC9